MSPQLATSRLQITECYPVISELRPHLDQDAFLSQVQRQMESGYQLAYIEVDRKVVAVAGFRLSENLAWGRFLYVDDLVTLAAARSMGHGSALLEWLKRYGAEQGCKQLHLDSGVQRKAAHRFYEREGMNNTSLHFCVECLA